MRPNIHLKWLHIWLQISSNCSQDSIPLMMQLELYDVMFFIRSLKVPSTYMIVSPSILALHVFLLTSSWNMLCQELTLQDIFTSTELLDWGTLSTYHLLRPIYTGSIKLRVQWFLWDHFICSFKSDSPCTYITSCALALNAHVYLRCITLTK